ncbi:hypothetical protein [Pseudobacteriovorax antillogorgiicola]|uniref:Uncharacterized protein n=2 Tax=Pseudobacteriovorax antillogorgiicola TaxID=1513793 RepID=A0A1Y6CG56_9BACT|nr:hypothetical protein [Pseudobacteriovorax antillogorgiicola]TCS47654.1 hypothetical protein EDD56_12095 [Pseudobacteriovorax antillogorgiicola]SMF59812.1 hypothetical protein SAMN06296036_12045 [Pseudobacteriovorax antillogorgiicola]
MAWRYQDFLSIKDDVRHELQGIQEEQGGDAKVHHCLELITQLEHGVELDQLRRLVYILCLLAHHVRYDCLSPEEVKSLFDLSSTLLQVHRVIPGKGKLSVVYGDIHLLKSQLYLNEGEFWLSTWEQEIANQSTYRVAPGGDTFNDYLMGMKALRFGDASVAYDYFCKAEEEKTKSFFDNSRIGRVRCLRLAARADEAKSLIQDTLSDPSIDLSVRHELEWELACIRIQEKQSLDGIRDLTKLDESHHQASYLIEMFFWASSVSSYRWLRQMAKIRTLARKKDLQIRKKGLAYKMALIIEGAYDDTVPLTMRMKKMEFIFKNARRLRNVDKELLIWLSLCRWLERQKMTKIASMALNEYMALSRRLSGGTCDDVLGIAQDLKDSLGPHSEIVPDKEESVS